MHRATLGLAWRGVALAALLWSETILHVFKQVFTIAIVFSVLLRMSSLVNLCAAFSLVGIFKDEYNLGYTVSAA